MMSGTKPVNPTLSSEVWVFFAAGFSADWGAVKLADALYTITNDISRIQKLLPELSPQDR